MQVNPFMPSPYKGWVWQLGPPEWHRQWSSSSCIVYSSLSLAAHQRVPGYRQPTWDTAPVHHQVELLIEMTGWQLIACFRWLDATKLRDAKTEYLQMEKVRGLVLRIWCTEGWDLAAMR